MEENILIRSEKYKVKKLFKILVIVGLVISLIMFVDFFARAIPRNISQYNEHTFDYYDCLNYDWRNSLDDLIPTSISWSEEEEYVLKLIETKEVTPIYDCDYCGYANAFSCAWGETIDELFDWGYFYYYMIPFVALSIIGALIYLWLNSYNLTVSDKRVSGEVLFGKKVDLPIDSISATSIISIFKGVGISTSSGRIGFLAIKNSAEIYKIINNLLIKRQEDKTQNNIVNAKDETEQLKRFKELFDSGVITQEEFDQKKKQLLGL